LKLGERHSRFFRQLGISNIATRVNGLWAGNKSPADAHLDAGTGESAGVDLSPCLIPSTGRDVDGRDTVLRFHAVNYFDEEFCRKAFGIGANEVVARLRDFVALAQEL
jgi:hypothetical protein